MHFLKNELSRIEEEVLSPELRLKRKHLRRLADLVSHLTIQDAQNFKKVYDMYKEPPVKFE